MLLVVVRKGNGDEDEQRNDGEHHHAEDRQGQQGDIELFVQVDHHILTEAVGLFARRALLLKLEVRDDHHHCCRNERNDDHHGDHAQQQDGERVIVIVDLIFQGEGIELHLHLHRAEGPELFQSRNAGRAQKIQAQPLHHRDQQRLDQLAVADVAQTPDQEGQLGENIAMHPRAAGSHSRSVQPVQRWPVQTGQPRSHLR